MESCGNEFNLCNLMVGLYFYVPSVALIIIPCVSGAGKYNIYGGCISIIFSRSIIKRLGQCP